MITDLICQDCREVFGQIQIHGDYSKFRITQLTCTECFVRFWSGGCE